MLSTGFLIVFPDSEIATNYSVSTKATCILNYAVAPSLKKKLVDNMMVNTFSVSVDGSNDVGLTKMNPLTVRIFDAESNRVVTQFGEWKADRILLEK